MSCHRDILQAKLVKGTRGVVKFSFSRKICCTQFYRLLEYQVNDDKKPRNFPMKIPRKYLDSAGGNLTHSPQHGTNKQHYRPLTSSNSNKREGNRSRSFLPKS